MQPATMRLVDFDSMMTDIINEQITLYRGKWLDYFHRCAVHEAIIVATKKVVATADAPIAVESEKKQLTAHALISQITTLALELLEPIGYVPVTQAVRTLCSSAESRIGAETIIDPKPQALPRGFNIAYPQLPRPFQVARGRYREEAHNKHNTAAHSRQRNAARQLIASSPILTRNLDTATDTAPKSALVAVAA